MFTHTISIPRFAFAAFFGLALAFMSQAAWSLEVTPGAEASNFYSTQDIEDSGTDTLDAINEDYPVDVQGTVDNPYLTDPAVTQSGELVDRINQVSPPDTSGTIDDPRYQVNDESMSAEDVVDTIESLDADTSSF